MGRWGDRRKAEDHDCQWAWDRDCRWEAGHDCRKAKEDVEAECRVAQKRQPQAGRLLADPAVAGQARTDAAGRRRQDYLEKPGVTVGRAELLARAWVRMSGGPEALGPTGVARWEPQASSLPEEQAVPQE